MKQDHQRVQNMLLSTVSMLCKNGLQFESELKVEGLIGITLDNNEVFLVHINEKIGSTLENDQIAKTVSDSHKRTYVDSVQSNSKHSEPMLKQPVLEIMPVAELTGDSTVSNKAEPRRRSSKSSENDASFAATAEEETNTSSNIVIKPEPVDEDDLILVGEEETKPTVFNKNSDSGQAHLGEVTSSFVGFGDLSESQGIETKHKPGHDGSSSISNPSGAFVTGLVKNAVVDNTDQSASWNSIGGHLVPGLPLVAGTSAQEVLEPDWTPLSGRKKMPAAAQGSSQSAEMVYSAGTVACGNPYYLDNNPERTGRRKYEDKDKAFQCEYQDCGKRFVNKHHLRRHETQVHGRKPLVRNTSSRPIQYW